MTDIVDSSTRSKMMSRIRNKNTNIEIMIRKGLRSRGVHYRLHSSSIPGKPDLVFFGRQAVTFIHGCFWHGHDCSLFKIPKTRTEFWSDKIMGNKSRDQQVKIKLAAEKWRVMTIWECALRGRPVFEVDRVIDCLVKWLSSSDLSGELRGKL